MSVSLADRVQGMVLGGAIGDGWGRPYEGAITDRYPPPLELVTTDDTQLTLATCEAVAAAGTVDPAAIAARFLAWFREGRLRGLGSSTTKALRDLAAGAHWALAGAKGERAAGNGAAMRIAPLAFMVDPTEAAGRQLLRDVSRITHHHDEAYAGALAVSVAVRLASRSGYPMARLLEDVAAALPDSQVRDRIARYAGFGDDVDPRRIGETWGASGFVADSVPLALFAARAIGGRSFFQVIGGAVSAGGDTDTIGSIAGQVAGAAVGVSGLPDDLLERLLDREEIAAIARQFAGAIAPAGRDPPPGGR
ncbi:MAG TPA: ADP-ribosylglycohydrolase family protein [Polyangia bacterium]|jgi:ADP-ribosylglycohydrolase